MADQAPSNENMDATPAATDDAKFRELILIFSIIEEKFEGLTTEERVQLLKDLKWLRTRKARLGVVCYVELLFDVSF